MAKIGIIALALILCLCTTSCAKLVDTTYEEVEVTIIDSCYQAAKYVPTAMYSPIRIGNLNLQRVSAKWYIYVKYNDVEYTISGENTYRAYKDRIGETVMGTLKTNTYDDGSIYLDITEIYDKENCDGNS